ncbi:MAG TPA: DEAD/DEAH box helicase [Polyangiaceae bacterium]|nr:DEAD/DEAH box helicase [Polyangiaceae bacterium]
MSDFAGLPLTETLAAAFSKDGIIEPTPVQRAAIAPILAGQHCVLESGTGTGKTLAYLLPVLQKLATDPTGRTVIMAPSAELAIQILNVARRYKEASVSVAAAVAGQSHKKAKDRLQKSTRLVVGSPGRLLELFSERKLKGVTTLVLDEPDPILVGDVPRALREILSRPEPKLQLVVAGATLGPKTQSLLAEVADEVARVSIRADAPLQNDILHFYVRVDGEQKEVDLARFIERQACERAIVFVSEPRHTGHLFRYLTDHRLRPVTLSDERTKQQRSAALSAFIAGKARVLITTDAAARGIDVPGIEWVLQYGLPGSAPAYVHRAGRTGRAGRRGTSVSFVTERELPILQRFAKELQIACPAFPKH